MVDGQYSDDSTSINKRINLIDLTVNTIILKIKEYNFCETNCFNAVNCIPKTRILEEIQFKFF